MSQPGLFDVETPVPTCRPCPFASGSDTSRAAAQKARWFAGQQGDRIYAFLVRCGDQGATDKEIAEALSIARASICARRKGLRELGRIQDSGLRRGGCAVWVTS